MLRYLDGRHAFIHYENDLKDIIEMLNAMRSNVITQFSLLEALLEDGKKTHDNVKQEARVLYAAINECQAKLEEKIYSIISRYNPQANELRLILFIIKLAAQIERMGDHCKNSIKRFWRIDKKMPKNIRRHFLLLVQEVSGVLGQLENILLRFEESQLTDVINSNKKVDKVFKKLVIKIVQSVQDDDEENIVYEALFSARNLLRLSDQVVEVVHEVYFIHHGSHYELDAD